MAVALSIEIVFMGLATPFLAAFDRSIRLLLVLARRAGG